MLAELPAQALLHQGETNFKQLHPGEEGALLDKYKAEICKALDEWMQSLALHKKNPKKPKRL